MFVSYAQNFEDVILNRALKSVTNGFYIDIGAEDPVTDSVSLAFYNKGWRGVHVEPNSVDAKKLRHARHDETVLEAALASQTGSIEFYESANTGLSTVVLNHVKTAETFGYNFTTRNVKSLKTSEFLDRFIGIDVHWLKIDVEGSEKAVIEGWSPSQLRPWIVVVESTVPLRPEPNHHDWEPLLLALGYEFVYFDGLNRFYVSQAHPELKDAFGPGPNVFDGFIPATLLNCQRALDSALAELGQLKIAVHNPQTVPIFHKILLRLAFHANGRPRKLVQRLLFHKNGRVRGVFRRIVYTSRGLLRPPFRRWLETKLEDHSTLSGPKPLSVQITAALGAVEAARHAQKRTGVS